MTLANDRLPIGGWPNNINAAKRHKQWNQCWNQHQTKQPSRLSTYPTKLPTSTWCTIHWEGAKEANDTLTRLKELSRLIPHLHENMPSPSLECCRMQKTCMTTRVTDLAFQMRSMTLKLLDFWGTWRFKHPWHCLCSFHLRSLYWQLPWIQTIRLPYNNLPSAI